MSGDKNHRKEETETSEKRVHGGGDLLGDPGDGRAFQ